PLRVGHITDVQQEAVAAAGAARQADGRIDGDVVALGGPGAHAVPRSGRRGADDRIDDALDGPPQRGAVRACRRIASLPRLDDAVQHRLDESQGQDELHAPHLRREPACGTTRGSGYVDVHVLLVVRIVDDRVRVRATTGLHIPDVFRIGDVADVEDPDAA